MLLDSAKVVIAIGSAAITVGVVVYSVVLPMKEVLKPLADKIRKCEEPLPRNEHCLIVAVPQTSVKDTK